MLKALLVDDEFLIRERIKKTINFRKTGFEIVGEAEDGPEALRLVEELEPHLIILDINIPLLNGIEVSRIIKETYPKIKIIILTGYGEFQFAQESIKIGVSEYILKPVDKDIFTRMLVRMKEQILSAIENSRYLTMLESKVRKIDSHTRDQTFSGVVLGSVDPENIIKQELDRNDDSLADSFMCVIAIEIDNLLTRWKREIEISQRKFDVSCISGELLKQKYHSIVFNGPGSRVVSILYIKAEFELNCVRDTCRQLVNEISEKLGYSVTIGIGGLYKGFENITNSYSECISALQEKFFKGNGIVLEYKDVRGLGRLNMPFINKEKSKLEVCIRTGNREGCMETIREFFNRMVNMNITANSVRIAYTELIILVLNCMWEDDARKIDNELKNFADTVNKKETIHELNDWLIHLCNGAFEVLNTEYKSRIAWTIKKVIEYMELNYSNPDLSIEEIARRNFISASYLSKIFKKEKNSTIIEFLNSLRMKKAKELMDTSNETRIGVIACKSGYTDPFYFSKLFKKKFGISPSRYIESSL